MAEKPENESVEEKKACVSSIVPCVVTIYDCNKVLKERIKSRLPISGEHETISCFKKYLSNFLGLAEMTSKLGLGDFEMKVFRYIPKSATAPADNFLIHTQGQWDVERPALLAGCGEVNGKFHGFQVFPAPNHFRNGTY